MTENSLPPLREIIEKHGLNAKKSLGQHFLLDLNITRKIARLAKASADNTVIEIGPGPGGLTRSILETGAEVIAIERDRRCIQALSSLITTNPNRLSLVEDDALSVDEPALLQLYSSKSDIKIISNLPYNISTELLIKWLKASPRYWSSLTLMFQKEVADRILAVPGNKSYGRLSIITQAIARPVKGFDLPARAFTPPPKVDSTVLHITPKTDLAFGINALEKVTAAAFSQRRKMLRTSVKSLFHDKTEETLVRINLNPMDRAEQISVNDFIKLANLVTDY